MNNWMRKIRVNILVETKRLIVIGGIIAIIAAAAVVASREGIGPNLSGLPEYKILSLDKNVSALYDEEGNLWGKWGAGEINATEFSLKSQLSIGELNRYAEQIDPEKVPEEWKETYSNYKSYILILRDAFQKSHEFAVLKERGNLTDVEEYYRQQEISAMFQQASETLQASKSAWPVAARQNVPGFRGFP